MSVDKNFEDLILKLNKENDKEIFSFFYENKKYWLKKARATSSNIFHKICYKLFSYDILVPVENKSPKESLYFESAKLKLFLENGIDVPKVVFRNNECFVMSDSGNTVYEYIKKNDIVKDEFEYYLNNMITLLSKIHNYGFYHGGAQSRNFTHKDYITYIIDLEDSFDDKIDIKTLQLRDLFLLLLSMTKIENIKVNYSIILERYFKETKNYNFKPKLKKLAKDLNFLLSLNMLKPILPRDVKVF